MLLLKMVNLKLLTDQFTMNYIILKHQATNQTHLIIQDHTLESNQNQSKVGNQTARLKQIALKENLLINLTKLGIQKTYHTNLRLMLVIRLNKLIS